jgi:hypothetical protein
MELNILLLPSNFSFSFSFFFVIKNKKGYTVNSEAYNIDSRQHLKLHQPLPNLTGYQKGI